MSQILINGMSVFNAVSFANELITKVFELSQFKKYIPFKVMKICHSIRDLKSVKLLFGFFREHKNLLKDVTEKHSLQNNSQPNQLKYIGRTINQKKQHDSQLPNDTLVLINFHSYTSTLR